VALVFFFALALFRFVRTTPSITSFNIAPKNLVETQVPGEVLDNEDQQLLSDIAAYGAEERTVYEQSLKEINSYISDAKREAQKNPTDPAGHKHLLAAYAHKAMLHRMVTARSSSH